MPTGKIDNAGQGTRGGSGRAGSSRGNAMTLAPVRASLPTFPTPRGGRVGPARSSGPPPSAATGGAGSRSAPRCWPPTRRLICAGAAGVPSAPTLRCSTSAMSTATRPATGAWSIPPATGPRTPQAAGHQAGDGAGPPRGPGGALERPVRLGAVARAAGESPVMGATHKPDGARGQAAIDPCRRVESRPYRSGSPGSSTRSEAATVNLCNGPGAALGAAVW